MEVIAFILLVAIIAAVLVYTRKDDVATGTTGSGGPREVNPDEKLK